MHILLHSLSLPTSIIYLLATTTELDRNLTELEDILYRNIL